MTRDEFTDLLMQAQAYRNELRDLANQRRAEEQTLMDQYKVDECNGKRTALIQKYQDLSATVQGSLSTIEAQLGTI